MISGTVEVDSRPGGFAVPDADLPGRDLDWLRDVRQAARDLFTEIGLPTRRDEEWKYSDPSAIGEAAYVPTAPDEVVTAGGPELGLADAHRLVLVNGRLSREQSTIHELPEGVVVTGLADALVDCPDLVRTHLGKLAESSINGFVALNTAGFGDGGLVVVPEGVRLDRPVLVLNRGVSGERQRAAHVRNLVVVGVRGSVHLVTAHENLGDGPFFTNAVTEAIAGDDAEIDHVQIELGGPGTHLVDHHVLVVGRSARVRTRHVSLGRGWARSDLRAVLDGEGAELRMSGVTLALDRRHVDFHTTVDHAMPSGRSDELFKTIADEGSTGVFRGRVIVRQDAQKTNAQQTNRNLLLSEGARVWTRPQLEIYADDVKCTHGATVGRLDDEALFYLRSRGIDAAAARRLLMSAFVTEVLDDIPLEGLRESLRRRLERRLPGGGRDEE